MTWAPEGEKRVKVAETIGGQSTGMTGNEEQWGQGRPVAQAAPRRWATAGDFGKTEMQ